MNELEILLARQAEILARFEQLNTEIGGKPATDEQRTEWKKLEDEQKSSDERVEELRKAKLESEERQRKLEQSRARYGGVQISPSFDEGDALFNIDARTADKREIVSRALKVVSDRRDNSGHLSDAQKERVERLIRTDTGDCDGELLARFMVATENPHYRSAFQKYASGLAPVLTMEEGRAVQQVNLLKRAMSVGTPSSGGYAVPVLIDPTIILTAQGSENDLIRLARVETITNDTWRGLSSNGVTWKWRAEAAAATDGSPTIAQPEVGTERADGFIEYSIEIGQDWPGFAEQMSRLLGAGYEELLVETLTTGTGANVPHGLIARLVAQTSPDVSTVSTTAATIAGADIYDLWARLPQRHRRKSTTAWMSSTDVQNSIRQLGTTDPNFTVDITNESIPRLFGKEYPMNDYMPALPSGTGNEALLVVGDFKGYLVAQRAGMSIEFIPMMFDATTGKPTGSRGWFAYARAGADVVDGTAFQLLVNKPS